MRVVRNTYPAIKNVPSAEPGDIVEWRPGKRRYDLVRKSDNKTVFVSSDVDKNGLKSNGKPPTLTGVIAQVKSKGWILEIES